MEDKIKFIRDYIDENSKYSTVSLCSSAINSSEDWQKQEMGDEIIGSSINGLITDKGCGKYEFISFARLFSDPECRKYGVPFDHDKVFHLAVVHEEESGNRCDYYVMYSITEMLRVSSLEITSKNIVL